MRHILFAILIVISCSASAQSFHYGLGYNYTFSPQWDKAIQSYNFSRPELSEKQPLLMHGCYANASVLFFGLRHAHGISLTYNLARSAAENTNFTSVLGLHMISTGYFWHSERVVVPDHFYFDAGASLLLGGIFRKVNGEALIDEDSNIKAFGIGGEVNVGAGYHILITQKLALAPFVQLCYSPYYYSPRSEALLNQTIELTGKKWTGIFTGRIGINIRSVKFEAGK